MGVTKQLLENGDGVSRPAKGDEVTIEYTGWIFDPSKQDNKGNQFDSSVGRTPFVTKIGEGHVIRGWDDGILGTSGQAGMTLGEKATLTISSDYGYGDRGFPGAIPGGATLVFDVELKAINGKVPATNGHHP